MIETINSKEVGLVFEAERLSAPVVGMRGNAELHRRPYLMMRVLEVISNEGERGVLSIGLADEQSKQPRRS